MKTFQYLAFDTAGNARQSRMNAGDARSALLQLKQMGLTPVRLTEVSENGARRTFRLFRRSAPGLADIELVTSKLAMLLKNGVKIDRALEVVRKGIASSTLEELLESLHADIRQGVPLSRALQKHPQCFDPLYVSVVEIGEKTGNLGNAFQDLAANLAFRKAVRRKTLEASFYPGFIFCLCCLVIWFMFDFIVPKLSVVFQGMRDLPFYTLFLLRFSEVFRQYRLLVPIIVVSLFFGYRLVRNRTWFQRSLAALMLWIPGVRSMLLMLEKLRFVSSLAILLSNRVPLSDALTHALRAVSNIRVRQYLASVNQDVRQGTSLSEALSKTGLFAGEFDSLIEIGEQTGSLAEVFQELAGRLKVDFENSVADMIRWIEPIMIVGMGVIVGAVVIVMLLSIVSINEVGI